MNPVQQPALPNPPGVSPPPRLLATTPSFVPQGQTSHSSGVGGLMFNNNGIDGSVGAECQLPFQQQQQQMYQQQQHRSGVSVSPSSQFSPLYQQNNNVSGINTFIRGGNSSASLLPSSQPGISFGRATAATTSVNAFTNNTHFDNPSSSTTHQLQQQHTAFNNNNILSTTTTTQPPPHNGGPSLGNNFPNWMPSSSSLPPHHQSPSTTTSASTSTTQGDGFRIISINHNQQQQQHFNILPGGGESSSLPYPLSIPPVNPSSLSASGSSSHQNNFFFNNNLFGGLSRDSTGGYIQPPSGGAATAAVSGGFPIGSGGNPTGYSISSSGIPQPHNNTFFHQQHPNNNNSVMMTNLGPGMNNNTMSIGSGGSGVMIGAHHSASGGYQQPAQPFHLLSLQQQQQQLSQTNRHFGRGGGPPPTGGNSRQHPHAGVSRQEKKKAQPPPPPAPPSASSVDEHVRSQLHMQCQAMYILGLTEEVADLEWFKNRSTWAPIGYSYPSLPPPQNQSTTDSPPSSSILPLAVDPLSETSQEVDITGEATAFTTEEGIPIKAPYRKLIVNAVPSTADTNDLQLLFSEFGEIEGCRIAQDRGRNRSKGYAFVYFHRYQDATEALLKCNYVELKGRRLRVTFSLNPLNKMLYTSDDEVEGGISAHLSARRQELKRAREAAKREEGDVAQTSPNISGSCFPSSSSSITQQPLPYSGVPVLPPVAGFVNDEEEGLLPLTTPYHQEATGPRIVDVEEQQEKTDERQLCEVQANRHSTRAPPPLPPTI